jgi:hypothetical protein
METTRIVLMLTAFLLIAYGYVTFEWVAEKEQIRAIKDCAIGLSDHPLMELADAGYTLEYLNNASDEVIRERVRLYAINARTLEYSSLILYETTGEERYQLFSTAMANLEDFFISVGNKPELRATLRENLNIINAIGEHLKKRRITDLSEEDVVSILNLSTKLKS